MTSRPSRRIFTSETLSTVLEVAGFALLVWAVAQVSVLAATAVAGLGLIAAGVALGGSES